MSSVIVNGADLSIMNESELFKHKLPSWKKENEVRIINKYWAETGYEFEFSRLINFPINSISGVIYGSRMSIENILTIRHLLAHINMTDIECYSAQKNRERNKLIFKKT